MRTDRRRRTLRDWRTRRAGRGLDAPDPDAEVGRARIRRRHRAPTPSLSPPGGWRLGSRSITALALVLSAVVASLGVARAPALHVHAATVRGNQRLSAEVVFAASGLNGRHVLSVDWRETERRLEALDGVRNARVRPDWPATVRIEIEEAPLVLTWIDRNGEWAVDESGALSLASGANPVLPQVTSVDAVPIGTDGRMDAVVLGAALAYTGRFRDVTFDARGGFAAHTEAGMLVRLGTDVSRAAQQLALLDALAARAAAATPHVTAIDLRFPSRPYYRAEGGTP